MYNIEKAVKIFLEKISGKEIDIDTEKNNVTILEVLNKYGIENGSFTEDQKTIEEALLLLGAEEEEVETGEGLNKTLGNVSVSIQKTDEESLPANAELKLSKANLSEGDLFGINISFLDGEGNTIAPLSEMIFTISYSGESSSHDSLKLRYIDQVNSAQDVESDKIVEITNKSVTFANDLPGTYIVYDPDGGGQR